MGIFKRKRNNIAPAPPANFAGVASGVRPTASFSDMVLNALTEGVIITDAAGTIQMINPAAINLCGYSVAEAAVGINFASAIRLENGEGVAQRNERKAIDLYKKAAAKGHAAAAKRLAELEK